MTIPLGEMSGTTVLVVESDSFIASYVVSVISSAGGEILGPVASADAALACIASNVLRLDAALLNIALREGDSYRVADELARRLIPFVFTCASPAPRIPTRHSGRPLLEKPFAGYQVVQEVIGLALHHR
jgi:CheY-like chemotaxis protein